MFLSFPVDLDGDEDIMEELGVDKDLIVIKINVSSIASYHENMGGTVSVSLNNGEGWNVPLSMEDFEAILLKAESIITVSMYDN